MARPSCDCGASSHHRLAAGNEQPVTRWPSRLARRANKLLRKLPVDRRSDGHLIKDVSTSERNPKGEYVLRNQVVGRRRICFACGNALCHHLPSRLFSANDWRCKVANNAEATKYGAARMIEIEQELV